MHSERNDLYRQVAAYYGDKLATHGQTARGVDWNSDQSQAVRFEQLCRLIADSEAGFSISDLGCGWGTLLEYLRERHRAFDYLGIDVSHEMIHAANERFEGQPHARFLVGCAPDHRTDYVVASGIFNVRMDRADDQWKHYLVDTLDQMHEFSTKGFAFNCLTSYSDPERMRSDLYYADPCEIFDLCKRRYSRQVALLHDYGLYEFTLLVRK